MQSVSVTRQIQDEAAAPPDGLPHASRKTRRRLALTGREFFLTRKAAVFLPPFFAVEFALSLLDGILLLSGGLSMCMRVLVLLWVHVSFFACRDMCLSAFRFICVCNKK